MSDSKSKTTAIVDTMMSKDYFSQWLGIELINADKGHCSLRMTVRQEMLNGFSIAHGGICYALADSALAFASNSHGSKCVSIETSVSHTASVKKGDVLTAVAEEINYGEKVALYYVTIINQEAKKVALFKGTVYRTAKEWDIK